jgi:acetylornithine deacetylase/succinyl-diaminopimelate desuccinylase-like protein
MATPQPTVDWEAATREATELLSRYIAIDTSNPPGGEEAAARFLADVFRRDGVECQVYPVDEGRANLSARLPGSGEKRPLVLLNHTDVVPVDREFWDEDPFGGVVKDGAIWGRGALDMKCMGIMELMTLLLLHRQSVPLRRDLVFMAAADEEMGSAAGVEWLHENHPELFEAEYVLNEGGYGNREMFGVRRPTFTCSVGEKGPLWLRLIAEGPPGHSSVPHADNCLDRLVRALYKVQSWERPLTLLPEVRVMFERLREAAIFKADLSEEGVSELAADAPFLKALLTDTVSVTMMNAGKKSNVIPSIAEANLDCRLLPGHDPDEFIDQVRRVIDDPQVEVQQAFESHTPTSPVDTELFRTIEEVVAEQVPEAIVLPSIGTGFTDSRIFRRRGVVAYGLIPCLLEPAELATIHGNNERISIESLRLGTEILFEVVRRMCT